MRVDFPTILGISGTLILCTIAIIMASLGSEDQNHTVLISNEEEYKRTSEVILSKINQYGITYQKNGHVEKFEEQMALMQQKQKEVTSHYLDLDINEVYIKESYNFPFRDSTEIASLDFRAQKPVCNIPSNIPTHLQKIQNSDLFQRFSEKYSKFPITFEMSDERLGGSWVHYNLFATSEDESSTASIFFHVDSCTSELSEEYNLNCHDVIQFDSIHTRDKNEVISSLGSNEFCTIQFESWKQALYDYYKAVLEKEKEHGENLEAVTNSQRNNKEIKAWEYEMERLGQLGNIVGYAMNRDTEDKQFQRIVKEYTDVFGKLPNELVDLIDNKK